jgi:hypothetical protein
MASAAVQRGPFIASAPQPVAVEAPKFAAAPVRTESNCPKCGSSVPASFKFCGTCGHPMADAAAPMSRAEPLHAAPPTGKGSLVLIHPDGSEEVVTVLDRGRVYRGGNIEEFERLVGAGGDRVLYVGDHIYGDVLRAKKESAWRTTMIVQEMRDELDAHRDCLSLIERMDRLERLHDFLNEDLRDHQRQLKDVQRRIDALGLPDHLAVPSEFDASRVRHRRAIDRLRARSREASAEMDLLEDQVSERFHAFWGSLFKAGPEMSLFGHQVEGYACLYTDRVSNLLGYSPTHYFRSPRDRMPHEE